MERDCDCLGDCSFGIKLNPKEATYIEENHFLVISNNCKSKIPESYEFVKSNEKYSMYRLKSSN